MEDNNKKELNIEEMEEIAGGLRTNMLTAAEKAEYNRLLDRAKTKGKMGEFGCFLSSMRNKYGDAILDDYEATHDRWPLSHYTPAE